MFKNKFKPTHELRRKISIITVCALLVTVLCGSALLGGCEKTPALSDDVNSLVSGISGDKNLTDIGKLMILRRIIMQNKDKFEYFGIACERSGFTDRMANAVTEFFSGGITPEALKSYAETFEEGSAVRNKLSDMALIYGEYRNFIKKDYKEEKYYLRKEAAFPSKGAPLLLRF